MILLIGALLFFRAPDEFDILNGWNFFKSFSIFHILWVIWVIDMVCQLIPIKKHIPLGSQKLFRQHFKPIKEKINYPALKNHILTTTKAAGKVMILWVALVAFIGMLYFCNIIDKKILLLISIVFYVCDLICVLIWCPFRLILKNRCCTTCRIFNWDHMMMFTPLLPVVGFFSVSLVVVSLIVLFFWEYRVKKHPEFFWEGTNKALRCSACTDKLCIQYCGRK